MRTYGTRSRASAHGAGGAPAKAAHAPADDRQPALGAGADPRTTSDIAYMST